MAWRGLAGAADAGILGAGVGGRGRSIGRPVLVISAAESLRVNNISGFILAAGEGRRLRPATLTRPKALVPFCGVPLLELAASQLSALGLQAMAVNVSYQG